MSAHTSLTMRLLILASLVAACGARSELAPTDDVPIPADADLSPLGISASFSVSAGAGQAFAMGSGLLWTGERRPSPGGSGGPGYRLMPGESVSVNGVAFQGGFADWGYTYQASSIPLPADGRWVFRFVLRGRTIVREVLLRPVQWVDFPVGPVSIAGGVTLRWAPPLPEDAIRRAYLTSCVQNDRTEISLESASFWGRLSANPCLSHAQLIATREVPLGAPFREGSSISAGTGLDRELRVVP
jgi:hypothetical protein